MQAWRRRAVHRSITARSTIAAATGALAILRFVDLERTPVHVSSIQGLHGSGSIRIGHLHESESSRPARLTIGDQGDLLDGPVLGKNSAYRIFGRRERQIANVQFGHEITQEKDKKTAGEPAPWFVKLCE